MGKWTRRAFITAGSLLGGGVVIGVGGIALAPNRFGMMPDNEADNETSVTTWIKITPDNEVIALIPHCEMGQGSQTGIAMMLAEELEADWSQVVIEEAPAESFYANGHLIAGFIAEAIEIPPWLERALQYASYKISSIAGLQVTGGSSSTYTTGKHGMRIAGAAAKAMLLQAAAAQWNVPVTECQAKNSYITHASTNRSASFGELANAAALIEPPVHPVLKSRDQYTLLGTQQQRRDIPSKVDGSASYGIDAELPGMLYAAVTGAPVNGGSLESVEQASIDAAMALPGVHEIVQLEDAVAVVADGYWQASQALKVLKPLFSTPESFVATTQELYQLHAQELDNGDGKTDLKEGDGVSGLDNANTIVEAEYRVPYLAHATMEPMSATAQVSAGRCEIWAGTQDPLSARGAAASAIEMDAENVTVHNAQVGGGFGRRLPGSFDYIEQAAQIAQAMSPLPVKLIWSREQDMQHDYYRVATLARFKGGLDATGKAQTWSCQFTAPGEMGASHPVYAIANKEILTYDTPGHLRVGSWRSVAYSQQGFFVESFADELAIAAGQDPYEYRLSMLTNKPRHTRVLEKVASMSAWGNPLPEGRGRGIAMMEAFGSIIAEVAEVSVENGTIKIHNMYAAVDCGLVVNPDQALAQVQGGMLFGLSSALYHEITLKEGAVEQTSFPDFPMMQLKDAPNLHVEFLESFANMGGLGEPGVPPVASAVANAIYAATGKRLRTLPLKV